MDTPMYRKLFVEMTQPEQDVFIAALQERRLRVVQQYEQLLAERTQAEVARATKQMLTHLRILERDVASAERAMSKVEERMVKVHALRAVQEQGGSDEQGRGEPSVGAESGGH